MKVKISLCVVSLFFCFDAQAIFLFDHFKELEDKIPYIKLANLPTPIQRCYNLEKVLQHDAIFIKRDDLTGFGDLYGGNKVRKLEFLLGDALKQGAKKIITYGCVGTNHGLATACYSSQLGLDCLLMLKHQPNSPVVRQNLLSDHYFKAKIEIFSNNVERNNELEKLLANNKDSYFFPTGGSVPLGALGFVNAAFELKEQIDKGEMPEPDVVYVPLGSCGTTAGLLLGFNLTNIHSKICAVTVEPEDRTGEFEDAIKKLFFETNMLLNGYTAAIPLLEFPEEQLRINRDFCGTEYGLWLQSTDDATLLMNNEEKINLEGTYSAKSFAALIDDSKNNVVRRNETILLWNTYCGLDFSHLTNTIDYKQLNPTVHYYFEDLH